MGNTPSLFPHWVPIVHYPRIFRTAKSNKEGKASQRGVFPHQMSFQNLTLLPSPTENETLLSSNKPSLLISFQSPTPWPSLAPRVLDPPLSIPYFVLIISFQYESLSTAKRQLHLHKRALLGMERFLIPNPPIFLWVQTTTHFTRWGLFSNAPPPQRKSFWIFSSLNLTTLGMRNNDIR